ncbi:MAG: hypothetical protein DRN14_07965 [Thermoplasmata archaeon]|nr:MAG: hypothetical protein DRN14_07965 [Thermoplasmata archaeon]
MEYARIIMLLKRGVAIPHTPIILFMVHHLLVKKVNTTNYLMLQLETIYFSIMVLSAKDGR